MHGHVSEYFHLLFNHSIPTHCFVVLIKFLYNLHFNRCYITFLSTFSEVVTMYPVSN